jgi:hypothetical protein
VSALPVMEDLVSELKWTKFAGYIVVDEIISF